MKKQGATIEAEYSVRGQKNIKQVFVLVKQNEKKLDIEKKKTLDSCYENVKKVLQTNKKMFDDVLNVLMDKGTITGEEFTSLVKKQN